MSPRDGIRRHRIRVERRGDSIVFFEHQRAMQLRDARDKTQIAIALALRAGRGGGVEGGPIELGAVGH